MCKRLTTGTLLLLLGFRPEMLEVPWPSTRLEPTLASWWPESCTGPTWIGANTGTARCTTRTFSLWSVSFSRRGTGVVYYDSHHEGVLPGVLQGVSLGVLWWAFLWLLKPQKCTPPDSPNFSQLLRNEGCCHISAHTLTDSRAQLGVTTLQANKFKTDKKTALWCA